MFPGETGRSGQATPSRVVKSLGW